MLQATDVCKGYKKPVLQKVSFEARRGEITGIAGANGSGKSTLLALLTGLLKPDSGKVLLDGKELWSDKAPARTLGYVPQDVSLFEELTCLDNIKFWAAAYRKDYKCVSFEADYLRKKVKTLSGGMKKRLSIALSLLNDPDFLIMDEPTSALDLSFKQYLRELMADRRRQGKAVIITSHQPDELLDCDKLYIIKGGCFVFEDSPSLLNTNHNFQEELCKIML